MGTALAESQEGTVLHQNALAREVEWGRGDLEHHPAYTLGKVMPCTRHRAISLLLWAVLFLKVESGQNSHPGRRIAMAR